MTLVHGGRRVEHAMFRGRRVPLFVAGRLVLPVGFVYEPSEWELTNGNTINDSGNVTLRQGGVCRTRIVIPAGTYEATGTRWSDRRLRISVLDTSDGSVIAQQEFPGAGDYDVALRFTLAEPAAITLEWRSVSNTMWSTIGFRKIDLGGGSAV